ncbi:MAG: hypothetical protein H6773_04225 [Pseudomonadales bacterium]|nr:hypothetical protein [Pseudomonadales bacterium]
MLEGDRGVEVQQRLLRILSRLREQEDKETVLNVLHNYMQILSQPAKRELIKQVYAVPFSSDILDADLLAEAWEKGALGLSYDISNLERNVTTISILREQYGPEVLEKIHSNYGVCHFGRYPIEVFHRFLNRDPAAPTVTLIYPYADRAGVFYEDEETFAELLGASQKLNFNIIEAGNGIDVYLRMKLLKSEYPETDLDVVLVGGHGETDLLELGTQDMGESSVITKKKEVKQRDLCSKKFQR